MSNDFARFLNEHRWVVVIALVVLMGVACLVNVMAVREAGAPDWYMHLAMWVLLGTYLALGLKSFLSGKRFKSVLLLLILVVLSIFWITILIGWVPAARTFDAIRDQVVEREAIYLLWLPVGLLGFSVLGFLFLVVNAVFSPLPESKRKKKKKAPEPEPEPEPAPTSAPPLEPPLEPEPAPAPTPAPAPAPEPQPQTAPATADPDGRTAPEPDEEVDPKG